MVNGRMEERLFFSVRQNRSDIMGRKVLGQHFILSPSGIKNDKVEKYLLNRYFS
jgi:hypothetical protein